MAATAEYHVVLDGQGFLIDPASYRRSETTDFAIKTRTGDPAYRDLLEGAAWAQSLWTDGVLDGSTEYDARWPTRSGDGSAVDVSYPGDVRLGRSLTNVFTTEAIAGFAVYRSVLIAISANSGKVYVTSDGTTWTLAVDLNTLSATTALGAVAVAADYCFVGAADSGKMYYYDGTTWTFWDTLADAAAIHALTAIYLPNNIGWPVPQIGVGLARSTTPGSEVRALNAAPSGAPVATSTYEFKDYPRISVLQQGHDAVFVGVLDTRSGVRGEIFQWTVGTSTANSSMRSLALLTDNALASLTRFREQAYGGTYTNGKIGRLTASDLVPFFRLPDVARLGSPPAYTKPVRTLAIDNDRMYAAFNDAVGLCLWQFDGTAWIRFATGGSGDPVALADFRSDLYVATGTGVYRAVLANYAASGTLTTSWFDAELGSITKVFTRVTLAFAPLPAGCWLDVHYALDDAAAFTYLGTANTVGQKTATFAFPTGTAALRIRLRYTLSSSIATNTPQLRTVVLEYQLAPALKSEFRFDPLLEGTQELPLIRLDRSAEPKTGAQLRAALWASKAKTAPLAFVDTDGTSYSVYFAEIEDHLLREKDVATRQGWRGSVKLVEA